MYAYLSILTIHGALTCFKAAKAAQVEHTCCTSDVTEEETDEEKSALVLVEPHVTTESCFKAANANAVE